MNDVDMQRNVTSDGTVIVSKKAQFSTLPPSTFYIDNVFEMRKSKSSCLLRGHAKDFKNVETFNLSPGYRLSRSAGKIYVSIQTKDPPPIQKPPPRKLNFADMEALANDLREQVDLLSNLLEEERLRHGGTKKRAAIDLATLEQNLRQSFEERTVQIREDHEEDRRVHEASYEARMKQMENQLDEKMEKKHTEYRMLQASFKIYQTSVQDEMLDEIKLKRAELEWENKRLTERAVDECKRKMEDGFSKEREEIKGDFKKNMNELIRGHRLELDQIAEKSKFQKNVNELMKRSEQLTITTEELEKVKYELGEASITNRMLTNELQETKKKLQTLERQFDSKVRAVEDQHLSLIDSLKQEKADVTRRLVRSCEELQVEKYARETAEKYRQEAAIITLQKQLEALTKENQELHAVEGSNKQDDNSKFLKNRKNSDLASDDNKLKDLEHESKISHVRQTAFQESNRVSHLISDITTILAGVESGHLPNALSGMLVNLTESEMKRSRMLSESIMSSSMLDHGMEQKISDSKLKGNLPTDMLGRKRHARKGSKMRLSRGRNAKESFEIAPDHSNIPLSESKTALGAKAQFTEKAAYVQSNDIQATQSQSTVTIASAYSPHYLSPSESMLSQHTDGQVQLFDPETDAKALNFYLNAADSNIKFPQNQKDNLQADQNKAYKDYKSVGFMSDVAFDKKTKLHGLTRAATSPNLEPQISNTKPGDSNGRWRGTFLARDSYSRPPIIFEVEKFKALTTIPPDSSKMAKKASVHATEKKLAAVRKSLETPNKKSKSFVPNSPSSTSKAPES